MKTRSILLTGAAATVMAAAGEARAQYYGQQPPPVPPPYYGQQTNPDWGHMYFHADAGGNLLQDLYIRNLGTKVSWQAGARGDVSFGYDAGVVAIGFETGTTWNSLDARNSQIIFPLAQQVDLYQIPIMANVIFKPIPHGAVQPYIGGGVGGVVSTLDIRIEEFGEDHHHHETDTDVVFGFEGMAGVQFNVAWNVAVDVGYKFMGTLRHTWFGDNPALVTVTDPTYAHAILASVTVRF